VCVILCVMYMYVSFLALLSKDSAANAGYKNHIAEGWGCD
jgi:hypothetical protein